MVVVLPTFKGYTVDVRLRQFRKADYGHKIEFVEFDSEKGRKLLELLFSALQKIPSE